MTKAEFDTVEVGDVLLAQNGVCMRIDNIMEDTLYYSWIGGSAKGHYRSFGYKSHISKGTTYGTHRTLRHQADFKAKP